MPITIDSVAPTVSDVTVTPKDGKYQISFNAEDNASDFHSAVVWVNGQYVSLAVGQKSFLFAKEPKSIVILAVDYAGNQSYKVIGDPSDINSNMAIQTISITPTTNINQSRPAKISAWAYAKVDWTVNVKDASGKIVDSFEAKNQDAFKASWIPKTDLPNGTYYITASVVTKDGFSVTTTPKTVIVVQ